MTSNRDLLNHEIGTPPPSTIDIDALIVRQRRLVRLRQTGIGLSAAAMTLAVASVLVLLPRAGVTPPDENVGASPTKVVIPPAPNPRKAEADRLTSALQGLVEQALPGVTLGKAPATMPGERPADPLKFVDRGTYFSAAATVTDATGTGTIRVSVGKESTQFRSDGACMEGPYPLDVKFQCSVIHAADGTPIEKATSDIGDNHYRRFYVEIIRADGNAVSIEVTNGVITGDSPYAAQRPLPLLTLAQVVAMVQEPSLATTLP
jgi:hypothetical protein